MYLVLGRAIEELVALDNYILSIEVGTWGNIQLYIYTSPCIITSDFYLLEGKRLIKSATFVIWVNYMQLP